MKKYAKELVILLLQMLMFYIFPLFAGPTDAMGMVVLIILATFVLSLVLGLCSGSAVKYGYPAAAALLFIPTVPLYYNFSAMIHAAWYLVVAAVGLLAGVLLRALWLRLTKKK